MDIFPKSELKILVEAQTVGCICVSIYMPAYRSGTTDSQQNPVRLKNLLRKAQEGLIKIGLRRPEADEYLAPAQKLLDDKIDVTAFFIWFIENYPGSVKRMKEEPGIQEQFKTV